MDLQTNFRTIIDWLFEHYMILNSEKCCYMCSGKYCADDTFLRNGKKFENSKEEDVLGVTTESKLTLDSHIKRMLKQP